MLSISTVSGQEQSAEEQTNDFKKLVFFDYRGTNALDVGAGAATIIGLDSEAREFGSFFRIGYKRAIIENLSIGLTFNKYDLPFNDIEHNLLSLDLGLEFLALPYSSVSPYVFGGFGYNASDDLEINTVKVQGGIGIEFIVVDGLGVRLFGEYNSSFEDQTDFLILDMEDDTFLRLGLGVNLYFGGERERAKRLKDIPTYIKSNSILQNK